MMAQFWIGAAVLSVAALGFVVAASGGATAATAVGPAGLLFAALLVPSAVGLLLVSAVDGQSLRL